MVELIVYDREMNRIGILENQTSILWIRKYYEPGCFEIHAPITLENLKLLAKENLITQKGNVEAGIIENIEYNESYSLNEIIVKGRFLSSYMDRRIVKQTINFNGYIEDGIKALIRSVETIPLLKVEDSMKLSTDTISFQATMKNLQNLVTKLVRGSALGYRFRPDFKNKVILFETYQGIDRTMNQNVNSRVVFSETYNNLNKAIYRWSDQLVKTVAIVGGEGDGEKRKYVSVGSGTGFDLREIFVDAKDLTSDGLTTIEYENILKQRGYETLELNSASETLEYESAANINFKYKVDYDLGDIVTVHKRKWDIQMSQRITEIQEVYENDGMIVIPVLGSPLPEKIEWGD